MDLLKIYSRLPNFRGKNFLGQKLMNVMDPGVSVRQTMEQGFDLQLNLQDRIQRRMFIKRNHEPETEAAFRKFLPNTKVFFDVGANIGFYSLLAKQLNPSAKVYAFEPFPQNAIAFHKNCAINNIVDAVLTEACVADYQGEVAFAVPPDDESGWGRIAYKDMFSGKTLKREVLTLDAFCSRMRIDKVDFLKVDVEGFEMKVLGGAERVLREHRPVICFEDNGPCLEDAGTSSVELFRHLLDRNYKIYYMQGDDLMETDKPVPGYLLMNYFAMTP